MLDKLRAKVPVAADAAVVVPDADEDAPTPLAQPPHEPPCACEACQTSRGDAVRQPREPSEPDPLIKDKCELLGRKARARALAVGRDACAATLGSCAAPWSGLTTTTWWNGGILNAENGTRATHTWAEFGATLQAVASTVQPKGTGYYFTPAASVNGRRRDVDIDYLTQLGLDCDEGHESWVPLTVALSRAGLAHIIDPSSRSTAEKPKWHAHIPYAEPIGPATHDLDKSTYRLINIWCVAWFGALAGLKAEPTHTEAKYRYGFDPMTHALGQPWFPGSRQTEQDAVPSLIIAEGNGFDLCKFLDTSGFDQALDEVEAELAARVRPEPPTRKSEVDYAPNDIRQMAIRTIAKLPRAIGGQNASGACLKVAQYLTRGFCLDEDEALEIMLEHYNPRCIPPWDERKLRHKLDNAARMTNIPEGFAFGLAERDRANDVVREAFRKLMAKREIPPKPKVATESDASADEGDFNPEADLEDAWEQERRQLLEYISAAYSKDEMTRRAVEKEILEWCALLDEKSARFLALESELQLAGVKIGPWKKAVMAARMDAALTPDEVIEIAQQADTTKRVRIFVPPGAEHEVNDKAASALKNLPTVYAYGEVLVDLVHNKRTKKTSIHPLSVFGVRESLSRVCSFYQVSWDGPPVAYDVNVPEYCPPAVASRGHWPEQRLLTSIVPYPFLKPSGEIRAEEGYDEETGIYFRPNFTPLPMPNDEGLTLEARRNALDLILHVMKDFPFKDARDTRVDETPEETFARLSQSDHFAVWLAGYLTPPTRSAYEGAAPGFAISANRRGAGKDKSKEVVEQTWLGREMDPAVQAVGFGSEPENEDRKKIMTLVLKGTPMVCVANIKQPFGNAVWEAALTQTSWSDRRLGTMEAPDCPLRITFFFNGNQLSWLGDLPRRVLMCTLETPHNRPEGRQDLSEPKLIDYVKLHRAELVRACLIILRAWTMTAKSVQQLPDRSLTGSYDDWSRVVRGAVVHAGMRDPWNLCVANDGDSDEDASQHRAILDGMAEAMIELKKPDGITCSEILKAMSDNNDASASWRLARAPVKFQRLRDAFGDVFPNLKEGALPSKEIFGKFALRPRLDSPSADGRILRKSKDGSRVYWIDSAAGATKPPEPAAADTAPREAEGVGKPAETPPLGPGVAKRQNNVVSLMEQMKKRGTGGTTG